jgi:hypothetical protein
MGNEPKEGSASRHTVVNFKDDDNISRLALQVRELLGANVVGQRLLILNHRDYKSKAFPPRPTDLFNNMQAALSLTPGHIVIWQGEYHSRVFDELEATLQHHFLFRGIPLSRLSSIPEYLVMSSHIVEQALAIKRRWGAHDVKCAVIDGVLHVAVRSHLSYDATGQSIKLREVLPEILRFFLPFSPALRPVPRCHADVAQLLGGTLHIQPHVRDHLQSLRVDLQCKVVAQSLAGVDNVSAVLMHRIKREVEVAECPYDAEAFIRVNRIPSHVANKLREQPPRKQQQMMATSLTSARDRAGALMYRLGLVHA